MFFNEETLNQNVDTSLDDVVLNKDPETAEGTDNIAKEIEANMQAAALESVSYFEGGEEAVKGFTESAEIQSLVEARKIPKKTFVRLGKADDLTRRENMACLIIAREKNDPLWKQLADIRKKERKTRNQIYARYKNQAKRIARISQKQHIKDMQHMKALPKISLN